MAHFETPGQCTDYPFFLLSDTWPQRFWMHQWILGENKKSCSITEKPWGYKDCFFLFVYRFVTQLNHGENEMLWNGLSISFLSWAKGKVGDTIDYLVIQVSMALQKPLRGLNNKADNDYNFWYCSLFIFLGNLSVMYEWNKKKISVDINIWYTPQPALQTNIQQHFYGFLWCIVHTVVLQDV